MRPTDPAYDVYENRCPTRLVLDRLADKWALLLKNLERDGLVTRTAFATVPVTVEYALTPLGLTLTETVAALAHWAERNMDAVIAAQGAYDARARADR